MRTTSVFDGIREYGPLVVKIVIVVFALVGVNSALGADQPTPERTGTIACETDDGVSLITYSEHEAPENVQDEIDLCERNSGPFNRVTDTHDFGLDGENDD